MIPGEVPEVGLASRTVLLSGALGRATVNRATAELVLLDRLDDRPVALLVNSPGGDLEEVPGLLDVLDELRVPLEVTALGRAHGAAGLVVVACAGRRLIGARASISIRTPHPDDSGGTAEELAVRARARRVLLDGLLARLVQRTGRTTAWLTDQLEDGEIFRAGDAVELGLVDAVVPGHRP